MQGASTQGKRASLDRPVGAVEMLRQKLPRLNASAQRLANVFYGPRSVSQLKLQERTLTWQWQHREPIPATELARLSAPQGDVWIAIERDHGFGADVSLDWRSLQDDARLLAWSLSYEPLILHLRKLLGLAVEPLSIVAAADVSLGPSHCSLAFTVSDANGDSILCGTVSFRPDLIQAASAVLGAPAKKSARADSVPIPFDVVVASIDVPDTALRTLECGDVVSLGNAERIRAGARMTFQSKDHAMRISVRIGAAAARVEAIETASSPPPEYIQRTNRRLSMPSQAADSPLSAQVDALPVTLSFEAGEISLTVAELKALAPGAMLSFGRKLTDSPITVRANGQVLGTGELVLIDDFLGVRIVELRDHGSQ